MEALVKLSMGSACQAKIVKQAIEVDEKPLHKSKIDLNLDNNVLKMEIKSTELGPLRATINAALREVKIASDAQL